MASMTGYMILLAGLSILLGFAGVATLGGHLLGLFGIDVTPNQATQIVTVTGLATLDIGINTFLLTWKQILLGLGVFAVSALALRYDIGAALKVGIVTTISSLVFADFVSIIMATENLPLFGSLIYWLALIIYLPIAILFFFTAVNWIGGRD